MEALKKAARAWGSLSLVRRILIGLAIGIALALAFPGIAAIELLGSLFVSALKAIAPILVFFLVISALANAGASRSMGTVILLYIVATVVAALVAVVSGALFPIDLTLADVTQGDSPQSISEVLSSLLNNIVANPVEALMNANYLGILAWAAVIGIALRRTSQTTKDVMTNLSDAVSTVRSTGSWQSAGSRSSRARLSWNRCR